MAGIDNQQNWHGKEGGATVSSTAFNALAREGVAWTPSTTGVVVVNSAHDPVTKPPAGNVFPERTPARTVLPLLTTLDPGGEAPGPIEVAAAAAAEVEVVVPFTGQRLGVLAARHETGRLRCVIPGHPRQAWLRVQPGGSAEPGRARA